MAQIKSYFLTTCIGLLSSTVLRGQEIPEVEAVSKIQLCLILDVSGSMDGLLSQAQNEIWKTIAFLEGFEKDSLETRIEIGVISYGNQNYAENGHIRIISNFTSNIEEIATGLFLMETGGGNEYCGAVIKTAIDSLSWDNEQAFKCIIIAGNEPFDQGNVPFGEAIKMAIDRGIKLNAIYCGEREKGIFENWETAATLGKGQFANIDQDIDIETFKTPYDNTLVKFYYDLESTFLDGAVDEQKMKEKQFDYKGEISPAFRDMIIYKFGRRKKEKDVIDQFNDNNWELDSINMEKIPEAWQGLDKKALKFKLLDLSRKRNTYEEGFQSYAQKVAEFLTITVQPTLKDKTLDLAMKEIMSRQLQDFGFKDR